MPWDILFGPFQGPRTQLSDTLFEGIDPSLCPNQFTFGRDGKPFYMRGPHETLQQAEAISRRVAEAGGQFLVGSPIAELEGLPLDDDEFDELELPGDEEPAGESL